MPQSVDDDTFLNMMDGDSFGIDDVNPSLAYRLEEGVEEEGFVDPSLSSRKRGARQFNYTVQEDEALVRAWEAITFDAVQGVEQSGSTYWKRIHAHYHRNKPGEAGDRTQVSLTHR